MDQEIKTADVDVVEEDASSVQSFSSEDIDGIKEKSNILPELDHASLEGMNFAELQAMLNSLKKSRDNAKMTMEYIDEYKKMKTPLEELAKTLEETNSTQKLDTLNLNQFQKEIEQFEKEYDEVQEKTEKAISEISQEIEKRYGDVEKTSSFILSQMIELIEKKESGLLQQVEKIEASEANDSEKLAKRTKISAKQAQLATMKKALNDRVEMTYWTNRFSNPQVLRKLWKEVSKNYDKAFRESIKYLCRYFKINDLNTVRTTILLSNTCPGAQIAIACIFYELYKNLRFERDSFRSWYGRVFIMNILDYVQGAYDFHEEDPLWLPKYLGETVRKITSSAFAANQKEYIKLCTEYVASHQVEYKEDLKRIDDFKNYARKEREKEQADLKNSSTDGLSAGKPISDEIVPQCTE